MRQLKGFILLSIITTLGSSLSNIALAYRFLLNTPSGMAYGVLIYAAGLSCLLLAPKIGVLIDKSTRIVHWLMPINLLLAISFFVLAGVYSVRLGFIMVFLTTALATAESAILFKVLPSLLEKNQFLKLNILLQEIASVGFMFGPIVAPLIKLVLKQDTALFMIDDVTFLIAGVGYLFCFRGLEQALLASDNQPKRQPNIFLSYRLIFADKALFVFFIVFIAYMLAFSPMAYALALIAKGVSQGNEWLYAMPIVAMFMGRFLALQRLKKMDNLNLIQLYRMGLLLTAIMIIPLSFIGNVVLLSAVEFLLGIAIAITKFSETSFTQLSYPKAHLAKLSVVRQSVTVFAKLMSIPVLLLLIQYHLAIFMSLFLGGLFLMAFLGLSYAMSHYRYALISDV